MGKKVRISDESVNCYGTRVLTQGIDLSQYSKNPVLLYMHDRSYGVVGMVSNLKVEGHELTGELEFDEASPLSIQLKKQYEFGSMRMVSANFMIMETSADNALTLEGQTVETVTKCRLFEVSVVDIGGNDNSIVLYDRGLNQLPLAAKENGACALPLLKNDNNLIKENKEMETKTLALMLGLAESATEQEVTAKINELKLMRGNVEQLEAKVKNMEQKHEQMQLSAITAAVDEAVMSKRISADKKAHFIELGKKVGLESLNITLGAIQPQQKLDSVVDFKSQQPQEGMPGDFSKFMKLSEVPSNLMEDLHDNHKPEFLRLYKAEYGFDPE